MMKIFDKLAMHYDENIVQSRFDHELAIKLILPYITSSILAIADLASGTGDMAGAANKQWPGAILHCEEPSLSMIQLLRKKYPHFLTYMRSLEETEISDQDLVMIAFNSINYVKPEELLNVFERVRLGMRDDRIFYFDAMTTNSAIKLLAGRESLTKIRNRGPLKIETTLTSDQLRHIFTMPDGSSESHTQYLISEEAYRHFLTYCRFIIVNVEGNAESLRSTYICRSK